MKLYTSNLLVSGALIGILVHVFPCAGWISVPVSAEDPGSMLNYLPVSININAGSATQLSPPTWQLNMQ